MNTKQLIIGLVIVQLAWSFVIGPAVVGVLFTSIETILLASSLLMGVGILLSIAMAVVAYKDCEERTKRNSILQAVLAFLFGALWGIIYLIITNKD